MPETYSKEAYLAHLRTTLFDRRQTSHGVYHENSEVFNEINRFIGHINGRMLDVLDKRTPGENTYAAAFALFPDDITKSYPTPIVDPEMSVRELQEDIEKVNKIKSITGYRPVEGLRWIDKRTLREVTSVVSNEPDLTIELRFADDRAPIILRIIPATVLVELTADQNITAEKVINFFLSDGFEVNAEIIIHDLLPKIPSSEIKAIIDWIDTIKLSSFYERKFNTLLIRDLLLQRYNRDQTGTSNSQNLVESPDKKEEVREFIFEFVQFLDRIKQDETGGGFGTINSVGLDTPNLPGTGVHAAEGQEIAPLHSISAHNNSLPARIGDATVENALSNPYTCDALLSYIYQFAHRIPLEHQETLIKFYERASELKILFPTFDLDEGGFQTDIGVRIVSPVGEILRRMYNAICFKQMLAGKLNHADQTGNFDVDTMVAYPRDFVQNSAYDLTRALCFSWYRGDDLCRQQDRVQTYIGNLIPGVTEAVKEGFFSRNALGHSEKRLEDTRGNE